MTINKKKRRTLKLRHSLGTQERADEINNGGATLSQWSRVPNKNKNVVKDNKEG